MDIQKKDLIEYSYYNEQDKLITIINRRKLAEILESDIVEWEEPTNSSRINISKDILHDGGNYGI